MRRDFSLNHGDAARQLFQFTETPLRLCERIESLLGLHLEGAIQRPDSFERLFYEHASFFFAMIGIPATIRITSFDACAMRWLVQPARSRNFRASGLSGTTPQPTSLVTNSR